MTEPDPTKKIYKGRFIFSEGMLLGAIPVAAYALGYSYESGFISFFGVPTSLVSIDATAMVSSVIFVAIYAFVLLVWISLSVDSAASDSYIGKSLGLVMMLGIFWVMFLLLKGTEYLSIIIYLSFGVSTLVFILGQLENKWNWLRRFSMKMHAELSDSGDSNNKDVHHAYGSLIKVAAFIFIGMIPFMLAYGAGHNNAKEQTTYSVVNTNIGELAVIRIYGDKIIAIPFDIRSKTFSKGFVILDTERVSEKIFKSEKVGPLKDKEN